MTEALPRIAKISAIAAIGAATVFTTVSPALAETTTAVTPTQTSVSAGALTGARDHKTTVVVDNLSSRSFTSFLQGLDGSSVHYATGQSGPDQSGPDIAPSTTTRIGYVHNDDHNPSAADMYFQLEGSTGPAGFVGSFNNGSGPSTATIQYKVDMPSANPKFYATCSWANGNADTTLVITIHNG